MGWGASRAVSEHDEAIVVRVATAGEQRKARTSRDGKATAKLRDAPDHVPVVSRVGDEQDRPPRPEVPLFGGDATFKPLDIVEVRLRFDDRHEADPFDQRVRASPIADDRHRDLGSPVQARIEPPSESRQEGKVSFVAHGLADRVERYAEFESEQRRHRRRRLDPEFHRFTFDPGKASVAHPHLSAQLAKAQAAGEPGGRQLARHPRGEVPPAPGTTIGGSLTDRHDRDPGHARLPAAYLPLTRGAPAIDPPLTHRSTATLAWMGIEEVFVAGAGLMGHGIAQVHAAIGKRVVVYEPDLARAEAGRERIAANLERAVAKGRLTATEREATLERIRTTDDLAAAESADLVIEAVFEDAALKATLWEVLDRAAPLEAIFATNTSSISIDRLAAAVSEERRRRFLGLHFFSPVPVMPLIELIRGTATEDAAVIEVRKLADDLGKRVIASADRPGFIVNRVLMPFLAEAMHGYEEGLGTAEDIDSGVRLGLNHPMGPLELADFIGLDVCLGVMRVLHEGLGGEHRRPPAILEELVATGHLGRKSGRGFYPYD